MLYILLLEFGTFKMLARPFLFPATERSRPKIVKAVFNRVVKEIQRVSKMSDHSLGLQKTIYDALDGDSTLQSLVSDVYDFVPEMPHFLMLLGEETSVDNGTKTLQGNEHTLVIHTFSRHRGSKETKEIMSRIYAFVA